jgi:shikimate kinase
MAIALVGPPSSGKSTVGAALAFRLGWAFSDTDDLVERAAGKPGRDVFLESGESEFRRIEAAQVQVALTQSQTVVAIGSGAVESALVRQALDGETVIRLEIDHKISAKRAGLSGPRPVSLGNVLTQWRKMMAKRDPVYAEMATLTFDTGELAVSECVDQIQAALSEF